MIESDDPAATLLLIGYDEVFPCNRRGGSCISINMATRLKVRINVPRLAKRVGIKNAQQLADRAGIHYAICYRLYQPDDNNGRRSIALSTLDKLCRTLKTNPNGIFGWH